MSAGLPPGDAETTSNALAEGAGAVPGVSGLLEASLAEQLRLLWEVDLGETQMAVSFELAPARD
jgi:hypothetical protein